MTKGHGKFLSPAWWKTHGEEDPREARGPSGYRDSPPVTVTPSNRSRYFAHVPRTCDSPSGIGESNGEKNGKKKLKKM